MAVLLLIVGLYLWFNKTNITLKNTQQNGFILGTILAVLNPQLILFWTTVITYIQLNGVFETTLFENNYLVVLFCFGATFGAFILHFLLVILSNRFIKISLQSFFKYADKIIAIIFVILAIVQIIKLLN
jgi:threonine/homoserine/homoserine lactone efflux protein